MKTLLALIAAWLTVSTVAPAQTRQPLVASDSVVHFVDSLYQAIDSIYQTQLEDTVMANDAMAEVVRLAAEQSIPVRQSRDWSTWRPDPQRALWLAMVIPGGGQIYNRKFWKLPIVYGGFVGCIYALTWNNMMYKDYAQAYLDMMDDDPGTASYNKFVHLGHQITKDNEARYKDIFKKRKDRYRRYRDLSFFVMVGIYAISVIDAYVDAELSEFDISKDLSLKVRPTVIPSGLAQNSLSAASIGVNCSINF